jgi:hypothetical protein
MTELCPLCRKNTNMIISFVTRIVDGADGKARLIKMKTYHCESCRSFVGSGHPGDDLAPSTASGILKQAKWKK